jgi:hypothetical protein
MRAPLTLLLGAFTCALAAPAFAAPSGPNTPSVHVLEIYTDDADDQAKALTIALKSKVRASKDYALADSDKALGVYLAQFKCGDVPDSVCQTKIADNLKADRYIWGTVRKDGNDLAVDVHLWQKGQSEVRQQVKISANLTDANDPSLQQVAEQLVNKLANFGKVGIAHLSAAQSIDGELFVDNTSQGRFTNGQAELTLPIGEHRFEVRAQGKVVAQGTGKVNPTSTVDVELVGLAKSDQPAPVVAGGGSSWKRPAGYAAAGVGGALLIGGVVSMLKVNSLNKDSGFDAYRHSFAGDKDVCDAAKKGRVGAPGSSSPNEVVDLCNSASTYKTLQFILLPVGALAAAAGVYLITTDSGESTPAPSAGATALRSLQIAPSVGKSSGSLDVRFQF